MYVCQNGVFNLSQDVFHSCSVCASAKAPALSILLVHESSGREFAFDQLGITSQVVYFPGCSLFVQRSVLRCEHTQHDLQQHTSLEQRLMLLWSSIVLANHYRIPLRNRSSWHKNLSRSKVPFNLGERSKVPFNIGDQHSERTCTIIYMWACPSYMMCTLIRMCCTCSKLWCSSAAAATLCVIRCSILE